MRFTLSELPDTVIVDIEGHVDDRGLFARTFCEEEFAAAGLPTRFVQSSVSFNTRRGTLRGLHYQAPPRPEAKLVPRRHPRRRRRSAVLVGHLSQIHLRRAHG
jgi:dTDP-4-dehydrorhamnose 3,5-epimerase